MTMRFRCYRKRNNWVRGREKPSVLEPCRTEAGGRGEANVRIKLEGLEFYGGVRE